MCIKDQIGEYLPQLLQIESGLANCGMMKYVKSNPELWRVLFESGNTFKISAEELLEQIVVDFSVSQLAKEKEIDTYKFFCDVLEAIDSGSNYLYSNIFHTINKQHVQFCCIGTENTPSTVL